MLYSVCIIFMNDKNTLSVELIDRLLPGGLSSPEELEQKYPPRSLPKDAMVTRFAPSPTGFLHLGSLYASLFSERMAHQSGGVFYLRVEDTDKAREISGAMDLVIRSLREYGVNADEGPTLEGSENGAYGPYLQSARENIYKAFIKELLIKGLAYPCFCTTEELDAQHKEQEEKGIRPGYYGEWAKWRDRSSEDIWAAIGEGKPFVIRFKSHGNFENKIKVNDILKGDMELSENDQDIVILKSDGRLPTYHLAHVVDDHLMRTTHVTRGDEWLSSLPLHLELFRAFGWEAPKYGHLAPIQKMDGSSKRKLSKRKDPEANIAFYGEKGYPNEAVIDYLLNLSSSDFEAWRKENPVKDGREFKLTLERMAKSSGPLFDFQKLDDISKETISHFPADEVCRRGLVWAEKDDPELFLEMQKNKEYAVAIFGIEREGVERPRKDIARWSDLRPEISYFFDQMFSLDNEQTTVLLNGITPEDIRAIISSFLETYSEADTKDEWFAKVKTLGVKLGFAESAKEFKLNKEKYKGQVGDVAKVLRVLLTGRTNTPDLHSIMKVMGRERVEKRLKAFL